jgi:hypothetical protein
VVRSFHYDFVRPDGPHLVVHAFGNAAGFALDAVKRLWMRQNSDLPGALRGPSQDGRPLLHRPGIKGTGLSRIANRFALTYNYPALCNGIASDFHAEFFSTNRAMNPARRTPENKVAAGKPLENRCAACVVFARS